MDSLTINIHEAKTNLSSLLKQVEEGREIVIARAGKPVATLTRYKKKTAKKKLLASYGIMKGKIKYAPDWDATDAETVDLAENGPVFPPG